MDNYVAVLCRCGHSIGGHVEMKGKCIRGYYPHCGCQSFDATTAVSTSDGSVDGELRDAVAAYKAWLATTQSTESDD